jgi:hypothetical protein
MVDSIVAPVDEDRTALETARVQQEGQVANLTEAIKAGGDIPILVAELRKTHVRLANLRRRLQPVEPFDRHRVREALTLPPAGARSSARTSGRAARCWRS